MDNIRFDRIINLAARDTTKGARIVAKVFYRILRKKGFSKNQIIDIATNILSCLTESLKGYEQKVENTKDKQAESDRKTKPETKSPARTFTKINKKGDDYGDSHYSAQI